MTAKELQALRRKELRKTKKIIEAQLHPNPIINGYEICHEHLKNGYVRFTAWKCREQINDKYWRIKRESIARHEIPNEFYDTYRKDLEWLTLP